MALSCKCLVKCKLHKCNLNTTTQNIILIKDNAEALSWSLKLNVSTCISELNMPLRT